MSFHQKRIQKSSEFLKRFMFNPQYQEDYKKILLSRDITGGLRAF